MDFYGMDTEQGEAFAQLLTERRATLEERAGQVDGIVQGIDGFWRGSDAESLRAEWTQVHSTQIAQAVERLWQFARELSDHAQEQDVVSAEGMGRVWESWGDLFTSDGEIENPFAAFGDWRNWLTSSLDPVLGTLLEQSADDMLKNAWRVFAQGGEDAIVPWLRTAYGLKGAAKYLGPVGHALTGVFAFTDRWGDDAGDPSLDTGERVARGSIDAGANIAGAAAGAWAGAKGGAATGALIGSIFPGPGTAIGGVVGGVVGAIGGGILGGGVADSIVDWALG